MNSLNYRNTNYNPVKEKQKSFRIKILKTRKQVIRFLIQITIITQNKRIMSPHHTIIKKKNRAQIHLSLLHHLV